MAIWVYLVLFLALTGHSRGAMYCLCKDGQADTVLQKTLDYACGAGADCSAIIQNGGCYQPNTVKDHCNYAVNSYFQKKNQISGSCDFSGTAQQSASPPSNLASTCSFPSSSTSTSSTTTPSTTPTSSTTPSTTTTPSSTTTPTVFGNTGLGPSGTGLDNSSGVDSLKSINFFYAACLTIWLSGLIFLW